MKRLLVIIALFTPLILVSCVKTIESQGNDPTVAATYDSYDCSYFSNGFNSLADCQTNTKANCADTWETFPNTGVADCYFPVTGFEACANNPPTWDWIYSYNPWCDTGTNDGTNEIYQQNRSLIGCSSTICICQNTVQTTVTCSGSTCANYSPNPSTASPAPSPCQ